MINLQRNSFSKHYTLFDIICIGSSIVDFVGFVTDDWLSKTGVEKGGVLSVALEDWDNFSGALHSPMVRAGGSAGTVVKGLGRLGCRSAFFSRSGNDVHGHFIRFVLKRNQVEVLGPMLPGYTARVVCAITPDAQRTFFFCGAGTNDTPASTDLNETLLQKTQWVHIEGYTVRNKPFLEKVLDSARKHNVRISIDLGSFVLVRENREYLINSVLNEVDLLFGNIDEMRALGVLKTLPPLSVSLRGELGCSVYWEGKEFHFPTKKVLPVDTMGAGDLFISGFLFGMIRKWPLDRSVALANYLGGRIVSFVGAELPNEEWRKIKNHAWFGKTAHCPFTAQTDKTIDLF